MSDGAGEGGRRSLAAARRFPRSDERLLHRGRRRRRPVRRRHPGAPVHCHPDEVGEAESDAAIAPYFDLDRLPVAWIRRLYPFLLRRWDGGAVKVAGTVAEGEEVAGFRVVHFPGHAPGLIGLWRESDRVALVSDVVYLVDSGRLKPLPEGEVSVPHPAWAWDHAMAKESVRKLAALEPRVVGAGHEQPLRGENLRPALEAAAEKH